MGLILRQSTGRAAARQAKRKGAELAIAIDGLSDRAHSELGGTLTQIRHTVDNLSVWLAKTTPRNGCLERVRGVASQEPKSANCLNLNEERSDTWVTAEFAVAMKGHHLINARIENRGLENRRAHAAA